MTSEAAVLPESKKLRSALSDLRSELGKLNQRIAELEKEHDFLTCSPRPDDELREIAREQLEMARDNAAPGVEKSLRAQLEQLRRRGVEKRRNLDGNGEPLGPRRVGDATFENPFFALDGKVDQTAVLYFCFDAVKAAVLSTIDAGDFDAPAGPPMAQRQSRLAELSAELEKLQAQRSELRSELEALRDGHE